MLKQFLSIVFLVALIRSGSSETGCPDDELVLPCKCVTSPYANLECKGVGDAEDLKRVFRNSERFTYKEVHIESTSLQYLPHDLFHNVEVHELYVVNVTFSQIFDSSPEYVDNLWKIHMEHVVLIRGEIWKLLEPMKSLRYLSIYYGNVKSLGKDFNENTPKSLEQLVFYGTNTKSIMKGAFYNFTKLDRVEISGAKLTELSRDIFDDTFNGKYLYFNENKISKISEDMFHRMPNIKGIMLRNNQLSGLAQGAFDGNFGNLDSIYLEGNPIKCDCLLRWLARDKLTKYITGKCVSPKHMNGRELKDLNWDDFNC